MRLVAGLGDCDFGAAALQRRTEARDQIVRQERRIARYGRHQIVPRFRQAAVQSRERTGKTADDIRNDVIAERCIGVEVLVGVDQQFVDLRCEALDHPLHHRLAAQRFEAFIDAAHAPALAAGKNDAGDE